MCPCISASGNIVNQCVRVAMCPCPFVHLPISPCICPLVHLFVCVSVCPCICSISASVCPCISVNLLHQCVRASMCTCISVSVNQCVRNDQCVHVISYDMSISIYANYVLLHVSVMSLYQRLRRLNRVYPCI